jgi:hypothetical protein
MDVEKILAVRRMHFLNYDPLEKLIQTSMKLDVLEEEMNDMRIGNLTKVNSDGSTIRYSPRLHVELHDRSIKIAEALMRYKYARVPEGSDPGAPPPPMKIMLTDNDDTFTQGTE